MAIPLKQGDGAHPVYLIDANGNIIGSGTIGAVTIAGPLDRRADAQGVSVALSTEDAALLNVLLTTAAFQARIPANGQALAAASIPTVLASDVGVPPKSASSTPGDAVSNTYFSQVDAAANQLYHITRPYFFNGSSWDRRRNNQQATLLASAARTGTTASADQTNYNQRGLLVIVNVTSAGTGSITPTLQVKDVISGNYFTVWTAAAAIVTAATFAYQFVPGAAGAGSYTESVQLALGRTFRLNMVHNNANSITYSASGEYIV